MATRLSRLGTWITRFGVGVAVIGLVLFTALLVADVVNNNSPTTTGIGNQVNGLDDIASACDHGNRVYRSITYGTVAVASGDPSCKAAK